MKCKHRFKTDGLLRLKISYPIKSRFYLWEFEGNNGLITHICVTVKVTQPEYWPEITANPAPGVSCDIRVISPHTAFVQVEMRTVQALLSLFGLRSIDINNPEIEWIAENDDERDYLKVYSYKRARVEPSPESIEPTNFDLIARAIFASQKAHAIEMPLGFFRRSRIDMHEQQFIEAIYDLYFVLETAYANGKFKKVDVLANFKASDELKNATEKVLKNPGFSITSEKQVFKAFQDKFSHLTVDEYLEHIVDLRGFLHHHTQRRKGIWNPENQADYKVDAVVLEEVVFNAVFKMAWPYFEDPEVLSQYKKQFLNGTV